MTQTRYSDEQNDARVYSRPRNPRVPADEESTRGTGVEVD